MSVQRVIDYVIESPYNVNKAVLKTLLDTLVEEVGPHDPAEEVTTKEELIEALTSEEPVVELKLSNNLTIDDSITVPSGKKVTINLNGKTLTTGNKTIYVDGGEFIIDGEGSIEGTGRPIQVLNNGKLIIEGGKVVSRNDCAITCYSNGIVEMNGGEVEAQEVGILATTGAQVTINGGDITTVDNFAIGGNGNSGQGGTNIVINGGHIKGNITSAGYVACGIYQPQDGTLTINGGEIIADGGCGIVMRAGALTVNGGTIIGSGESGIRGKVGDSKITIGPNGITYDQAAHYPDGQNLSVNITNGYIIGVDEAVEVLKDEGHQEAVVITGGVLLPTPDEEVIYDGGDV